MAGARDPEILPDAPPRWIRPERIGVFTVESWREVGDHLKPLGIETFQQKLANLPDTILEEIIGKLLATP